MPNEQKLALVRPPSTAYAGCLRSDQARAIDVPRALEQHRQYAEALRRIGLKVVTLPAEPFLPDACFVEDTAVVRGKVAAMTRPGAPSRRSEILSVARALEPFVELRHMKRGQLDGGDVMLVGDIAFVGLTARTDREGARELGRVLEIEVQEQPLSDFLHLKTAMTPLGTDRVLKLAGALPDLLFPAGVTVIETSEPLGANLLAFADRALCSASAPRTAAQLEALGFRVERVELGEFHAGDAGVTCLSLIL